MGESPDESPGDELRAGAGLLFDAVSGLLGLARGLHRAILLPANATRPTPANPAAPADPTNPTTPATHATSATPADPAAAPPRSVVELAFGGFGGAAALGALVTDRALELSGLGRRVRPLQDTGWGRHVGAALHGAVGDHLASRYPALATPLRLRVGGADVPPRADALAAHYPGATGHLVVLLHGLVHDENSWRRRAPDGTALPDFGRRLADDLGATALYVRYNSGRRIGENGRELADLLAATVAAWPVPVRRISLVGHSMGGLVARSAVHQAIAGDEPWLALLADVVCLGSPHRGSGVERGADRLGRLLGRFGPTAPVAALVDRRSAGIKDLGRGLLDDGDKVDRRYAIAPHGRQHFLAGTIARNPAGVPGRVIGDLLVTPASATDASQPAERQAIGGLSHLDLLRHPRVYAQVRRWLARRD